MYRFHRREAKRPKYNTVNINIEAATPRCLIRSARKEKHTDYSPILHLSTTARSVLKRPAAFHSSASLRILRMTDASKCAAWRWHPQRSRHSDASKDTKKSGQPQSNSLGHLRPFHARIVASLRVRSHPEEADPLCPTIADRQPTQSALETHPNNRCVMDS
jgi:hypothetical protein